MLLDHDFEPPRQSAENRGDWDFSTESCGTQRGANGGLAQLVERYNGIVEVRGSTPLSSTLLPDSKSNKPRESPEAFFVDASEAVQRKAKIAQHAATFRTMDRTR